MSADDLCRDWRLHFFDVGNYWVDRRHWGWDRHFLTRIGDWEPVSLNQRFLTQVGAHCPFLHTYCRRRCGNLAHRNRAERN